MARRVRSSPKISVCYSLVSVISITIIGGVVLFPILGIGSVLLVAAVILLLSRSQDPCRKK